MVSMNSHRSRGLTECLEVSPVDQVNAQHRQNKVVEGEPREVTLRLRDIPRCFPPHDRDVPFPQPRNHGVVGSSCLGPGIERSDRRFTRPAPPP